MADLSIAGRGAPTPRLALPRAIPPFRRRSTPRHAAHGGADRRAVDDCRAVSASFHRRAIAYWDVVREQGFALVARCPHADAGLESQRRWHDRFSPRRFLARPHGYSGGTRGPAMARSEAFHDGWREAALPDALARRHGGVRDQRCRSPVRRCVARRQRIDSSREEYGPAGGAPRSRRRSHRGALEYSDNSRACLLYTS